MVEQSALDEEFERLALYRPNEAARLLGVPREALRPLPAVRFAWGGGSKYGYPRDRIRDLIRAMTEGGS